MVPGEAHLVLIPMSEALAESEQAHPELQWWFALLVLMGILWRDDRLHSCTSLV